MHYQWKPHHQDAVCNQKESVSDVDLHVMYAWLLSDQLLAVIEIVTTVFLVYSMMVQFESNVG